MNRRLTLGSLFDGSGGFPLGGLISGITPIWSSEIEPFCIRVTSKRLPSVKHYGNVSDIKGGEIEPVDIITFGSPCQDMSVAGKRSGLDGERSSLFYEAIRIIKEMRCKTNGEYPRFIVWENVPGAFSSNKGEDFKAVLDSICKIKYKTIDVPMPKKWSNAGHIVADGFSLAWRVFDAQYWGVPQRRKRIYLVADFADECAGKILFESEGLSGNSEKSLLSWQRAATCVEKGIGATGGTGDIVLNDQGGSRMDITVDKTCTLRAESHHPPCVVESSGFCTEHSADSHSIGYEKESSSNLRAGTVPATVYENHGQDSRFTGPLETAPTVLSTYGTGGNNQPFVVETPKTLKVRCGCKGGGKGPLVQENKSATLSCNNDQTVFVPKCFGICSKDSNSMKSSNPHSGFYEADTTRTLDSSGGNPSCNQGGMAVVALQGSMIGRADRNGPQGSGIGEEVSFTLNTIDRHAVAFSQDAYDKYTENDKGSSLRACGGVYGGGSETLVYSSEENKREPQYIVRRLIPTECARLQGFPDLWCSDLGTETPTAEDIKKWKKIFSDYNKAIGRTIKEKTDNQIIKWLKNPHSDSAEYRMWGNGVSLPCVCFVLRGIAYYS